MQLEVAWPKEFIEVEGLTPRDVFGNKLQSLDFIRTGCEVYITLLPDQANLPRWQVEICGYNMEHVLAGEDAYKSVIKKIHTQKFLSPEKITLILDENEGFHVLLKEAEHWWPQKAFGIVPRLISTPMADDPGTFRTTPLHFTKLASLQNQIERYLKAIQFEKGSYDLSIRYGCLALGGLANSEIRKQYGMNQFIKGLNTTVDCHVNQWFVLASIIHSNIGA